MMPITTRTLHTVAAIMSKTVDSAGPRVPKYRNKTAKNGAYSAVLPWARTSLCSTFAGSSGIPLSDFVRDRVTEMTMPSPKRRRPRIPVQMTAV
jgi:hypothetical protein